MAPIRGSAFRVLVALVLMSWPSVIHAQTIGNFFENFQQDFNEAFRPNKVKPRYKPIARAPVIETSLRPRARQEIEGDAGASVADLDPALARNGPLMNYRNAVLARNLAKEQYLALEFSFVGQSNPRAVEDIYSDLATLPGTTELGSAEAQVLLNEFAIAVGKAPGPSLTRADVLRARQDLARAEIAVTETREQLLPNEDVTDETIAVLHEMLKLPPAQ